MIKEKFRKYFLYIMFLGALIGATVTTLIYSKISKTQAVGKSQNKSELLSDIQNDNPQDAKAVDILLLGYGGAGHSGGTLSDTVILTNIDTESKKISFISIPRDLWVAIPYDWDNLRNFKINEAYSIGGNDLLYPNKKPEFRGEGGRGALSKYVVQNVTGLNVNYFISVDFAGLVKTVDLLGGIEVNVPVAFDDYFYPIKGKENETCGKTPTEIANLHSKYSGFDLEKQFECRYEHLHFDQGLQRLSGDDVLKYVRSRHSTSQSGDFSRSIRQFTVLEGIKNKIISLEIIPKADPLFDQLVSSINSDMKNTDIKKLISILSDYTSYSIKTISLTDQNVLTQSKSSSGQFILIPKEGINKWSQVQKYIQDNLNN